MQPDDAVEECARDRRRRVRVAEGDEVRVLGEAVHHGEDDRLPMYHGEPLDEVHGDVRPHLGRNHQRLQQTCRLQGLRLVALACTAGAHPVLEQGTIAGDVEVGA